MSQVCYPIWMTDLLSLASSFFNSYGSIPLSYWGIQDLPCVAAELLFSAFDYKSFNHFTFEPIKDS